MMPRFAANKESSCFTFLGTVSLPSSVSVMVYVEHHSVGKRSPTYKQHMAHDADLRITAMHAFSLEEEPKNVPSVFYTFRRDWGQRFLSPACATPRTFHLTKLI